MDTLRNADLAILSCGTLILETLGVPSIGVVVADNQLPTATYLQEAGAIIEFVAPEQGYENSDKYLKNLASRVISDRSTLEAYSKKSLDSVNRRGVLKITEKLLDW